MILLYITCTTILLTFTDRLSFFQGESGHKRIGMCVHLSKSLGGTVIHTISTPRRPVLVNICVLQNAAMKDVSFQQNIGATRLMKLTSLRHRCQLEG